MQMVPVIKFAKDLAEWPKGNKQTTLVKLAATYETQRPTTIKLLTDATKTAGTEDQRSDRPSQARILRHGVYA